MSGRRLFSSVLIANRGTIACRIQRTLKRLGIRSVAVYSEADAHARHVLDADVAVPLGPAPAAESYLRVDALLAAARNTGAEAIHPGYGFLSENAEFAEACEAAGLAFIGPTAEQMRAFGLKHRARELAEANNVPMLPGTGLLDSAEAARDAAQRIGYPVMLKSTAGGGGIGMRLVRSADALDDAFAGVKHLSAANFKQAGVFLERFVEAARHIEVQIFGNGRGHVVSLGERDCSAQRRNQKVLEETPAPGLDAEQRRLLSEAAVRLAQCVEYRSAGTVEFVFDAQCGAFYFLEVNTRLQVEHGVTEEVFGIDLVEWMVRLAAGDDPAADFAAQPRGHAIQARIYAEDPALAFRPSAGLLTRAQFPATARVETWVETGTDITPYYDPLLAKVIVHGSTRDDAARALTDALHATHIDGIESNVRYLRRVVEEPAFLNGQLTTAFLNQFRFESPAIEVLDGGTQTTLQDWPGRLGFWNVGVPPSGPMDNLAFRLANRLVGNAEGAPALEMAVTGPKLKFRVPTVFALSGADMDAQLDGQPVAPWRPCLAPAGATLKLRGVRGAGARSYLAVAGGFDVAAFMGSCATFTLGKFGGHAGRALRAGDVLHLVPPDASGARPDLQADVAAGLAAGWRATFDERAGPLDIPVLFGPHGAPDFFTPADIDMLFATEWQVHYHSDRTGVRLIGPRPQWARRDGGEAGLHPSNIHDNAYAIGAVDFTGDMPILLGPDGPSLGGFVCPAVVVAGARWMLGQLRAGDRIRFRPVTEDEAAAVEAELEAAVAGLTWPEPLPLPKTSPLPLTLHAVAARRPPEPSAGRPEMVFRRSGDKYLLVEYGPLILDLPLRFRVHALMRALEEAAIPGVLELTPGIRSLQIHFENRTLSCSELIEHLVRLESALPHVADMEVETRVVHLPLSWDDPATRLAIERYMSAVRPDAPWCPSNIEFIRRVNGLASVQEVQDIVFAARYLVLGLGDVYLGAPVATPVDPRHRLVTTKYNPARTWTPENAVGIGGAYLCVYGMEGPGGYQFVGRTVQMWNTHRTTAAFQPGAPWLLRFFDQIQFYPVSADELLQLREDFPRGRAALRMDTETFRLRDYQSFLLTEAASIDRFKTTQQTAFEAERERWAAAGAATVVGTGADPEPHAPGADDIPPGCVAVTAPLTASVWKILVEQPGAALDEDDRLLILEAMKTEIPIGAPCRGTLRELRCEPGRPVVAGQILAILDPA